MTHRTEMREVKLGAIAAIVRGVSFEKHEASSVEVPGTLPVLRAGNIQEELLVDRDLVWVPRTRVSSDQLFRRWDIAIAVSSGSAGLVGKTAQLRADWAGSVGAFCAIVRAGPDVEPEFLALWLRSNVFTAWRLAQARGSNIQNLSVRQLALFPMALPGRAEQARICRMVQASLVEIREGVRISGRGRMQAATLERALIDSAFRVEAQGPIVRLQEVSEIRSGLTKGRKIAGPAAERPFLRAGNLGNGRLDLSEIKTTPATDDEAKRYRLETGDVLLVEGSGSPSRLAQGWVWEGQLDDCLHQNHVFRVRPDKDRVEPHYLAWMLQSSVARDYFLSAGKTTSGLNTINRTQVGAMPLRLPPVVEQRAAVEALSGQVDEARQLAHVWDDAHNRLERMRTALFDQAIRGEI